MAVDKEMDAVFKSSRTGYKEGGSPKPRNRWEMFKQWLATEKKEDEDEASAFDRFLDSFMGDPIERGKRKKKAGQYKYAEGGEVGEAPDTTIGVDPVSGNEVPMGATPEEVRDDIPAQLSEGEYVVPADVVRFYGVKFFEDLRTEAKRGYAEMDQNGRIGGESIDGMELVEPEDDLPFDLSELQMIDDDEEPAGMASGGYAIGGDIEPIQTQPFSFQPEEITTKKYVDSSGNIMYVTFSGDTPLNYIPPEFRPEEEATAAAEAATPVIQPSVQQQQPTVAKDDGTIGNTGMDDVDEAFVKASTGVNWSTAKPEDFQKATDRLGSGKAVARGLALLNAPLGIAAGIGMSSAARNNAYNMLDGIAYQLENNSDLSAPQVELLKNQQSQIRNYLNPEDKGGLLEKVAEGSKIFGGQSSMFENLSDFTGDDRATFADTWLGDLLGFDGKAGIQARGADGELLDLAASRAGKRRGGAPEYAGDASKYKTKTPDTPYQAAMKSKDYDTASSVATNSWIAATNAANSIKDKTSVDFHKAIKAQSEASKAATAAIQARTAAKKSSSKKSSSKKSSSNTSAASKATGGKGDQGKGSGWGGM